MIIGSDGFLKRRIPGKNGEVSPRVVKIAAPFCADQSGSPFRERSGADLTQAVIMSANVGLFLCDALSLTA